MPNHSPFGHFFGWAAPAPAAPPSPPPTSARLLLEKLRRQPIDLRLEVVLADLLAHGYQLDEFVVRPASLFARRYRRDIGAITEEPTDRWHSPKIGIEVHREGLYDALPQQLFHHPGDPTPQQGARAMVEDIQAQRRREKATRRFFLPLEQEFFRFRVLLEQEERRYMTNLSAQWYNEVLARFWELSGQLPPKQVTALLYLLPLAHRITGDLDRTRQVFESILEVPVRLRTIAPLTFEPETSQPLGAAGVALGQGELGRDFVLSGAYHETLPALEISLQSLSAAELQHYLAPDTWQSRALKLLCSYFVAFETDVVVRYEMSASSQSFVLSDEGDTAVLGYTTVGL
ncbi:type VI secretion system baseplate subunit TssG [Hymenobacter psychrotolerans]|uniref:Type VI secretion, VasB, ImpH, VC_A0111 n=1 Tax=Hymenobacter psychrotolerans DSM 18569 TaxID=1121959 RepID=A0A1M7DZG4_9BACT|nr:type VI secretion system baseplate subunit TssG [Hymenobacter psychrotolerans]SHL84847.1 Type VI secretion, VasB, ImpH, VC_A0111 [Hymenobacter psychrotolerans DSM 18569]